MTAHLVAEEIQSRGLATTHIHSWDDYDRLRKIPNGFDPEMYKDFVGMPLSMVPDFICESHESYATHFIEDFMTSISRLGISFEPLRQSERYASGVYNKSIRHAMNNRFMIYDILSGFQTETHRDADSEERRRNYFPFKPYCQTCHRDFTTVTGYETSIVSYNCKFGHRGEVDLSDGASISGKLVWKVDWPMRWAFEQVDFESAGEDHHAPSSSFASGSIISRSVFDNRPPHSFPYSFVGLAGAGSKMSGSKGLVATPGSALRVLEPPILRWLYARRLPSSSFTIDLSPSAVFRLYDEWDRLTETPQTNNDRHVIDLCRRTSNGTVEQARRTVSFRFLAAAADLTQNNKSQIDRLIRTHVNKVLPSPEVLESELEPRLTDSMYFAAHILPAEMRTVVRDQFNLQAWEAMDPETRTGLTMLDEGINRHWNVDELTRLVYTIPKTLAGLPADAAPSPELKAIQRKFFRSVYQMLCTKETGPRLPTLLLSLGPERAHKLLQSPFGGE